MFLCRSRLNKRIFTTKTSELLTKPSGLRWNAPPAATLSVYKDLSKARLAALVVLTTMSGYSMAPGFVSLPTLLYSTVGTTLCVSSANTINQWMESPFDSQMNRTRNRVLVRRSIYPSHAFMFGITCGVAGVTTLWTLVNPITACLGGLNILLYTAMYTPMKRSSVYNTWVGSVVGAIPPMMGWAACTDVGAFILAGILFAWQFPHFNALSYNLRPDYSKAGYHMLSVLDPKKNALVGLRYSLALFPLCIAATYTGMTSEWFLLTSSLVNISLLIPALRFWRQINERNARVLFFASLFHLPLILALLMLHKINN